MNYIKNRIRVIFLLGIFWTVSVFSQDEIKLDIHPSKISTHVSIIVPYEQCFLFERYYCSKGNYWLGRIDTLNKGAGEGVLQGDGILINSKSFVEKCNKCDTVINKIRNSSLNHKLHSELRNIVRMNIGYDNKEFRDVINNRISTVGYEENKICHEEFKESRLKWFNEQILRIYEIRKLKEDRLFWIKNNKSKIDKQFIEIFLQDYGSCEADQAGIIELIELNPEDFLKVCDDLNDSDFYKLRLKLSFIPKNVNTNDVILKIKSSKVKSNRVKKIIRVLR